jgi:hypothetical protein
VLPVSSRPAISGIARTRSSPTLPTPSYCLPIHAITPPTLPNASLSPLPTPPAPPTHAINPFFSQHGHILVKPFPTPHSVCSSHAG